MKYISIIKGSLVAISILLIATSCEKILDQKPFSQLSDEQFWKTTSDAENGVTAIYDAMQKAYNSQQYIWGELRADNYVRSATPTADALEYLNNSLTSSNAGAGRWNNLYLMISRANLAITKIPTISGYSKQLLGEAHALRAFAYFTAVRVWGDVPLYTEAISGLDADTQRPRTSAEKIMNEVIIPDMLKAEELLSIPAQQYRFSKASIYAFEGEVYMFLKDYAKAKVALTKLNDLKTHSLVTTREAWVKQFFNMGIRTGVPLKDQTGPELIFTLKYSLLEDSDRSGVYSLWFAGLPSYYISPALENKWLEKFPLDSATWVTKYPTFTPKSLDLVTNKPFYGDWRYVESREATAAIGLARVAKYTKTNINGSFDDTDINIFRYSNSLTLLAEAENQLGNAAAAITIMNSFRTARQLPTVKATDFPTKNDLENFILDERQMEFLAEGIRWWDLRRTGKAVQVMQPINGQTEERLLFPLFDRHLIDNKNLVQNPGY